MFKINSAPVAYTTGAVITAAQVGATTNNNLQKRRDPVEPLSWHHAFGWALYLLVGFVLFFGMAGRLAAYISYQLACRRAKASEDIPAAAQPAAAKHTTFARIHTLYRRHISSPAAFGNHHMRPVGGDWFSIPTRLQAIMIFVFVAINVIFSFVGIRLDGKSPKSRQLGKQIGDRAGVMAFYDLPLLWALAGRNDVLIWLTGWSFRSMNLFHRWVARMAVFHAIVHSAAYTWLNSDKLAAKFQKRVWATGIFSTVFMCLILAFSVRPIRTKYYEFFLITHIVISIAVLVLLFFHIKVMGTTYNAWLWACVGVWAFDRVVRFLRIAILSFRTVKVNESGRNSVARIADHKTGLIRLTVDTSFPINPSAGAYYFLYTPWSMKPWESHPFSLASWEPSASGTGTTLHFLIAPRAGGTRRLKNRIEKAVEADGSAGSEISLRVLMEGPYGVRHPVHKFDHVLLIAGGTGITAMLPYVFELARLGRKNVTVAWIVKDASYANDVLARELSRESRGHANVSVFVSSAGALVRLDSQDTLQGVTEKGKKFIESDSGCESGFATPVDTPAVENSNPFDSRCSTPVESPGLEKKGAFDLNGSDSIAQLVMKKNFLSSRTRTLSSSSSHSGWGSGVSTPVDTPAAERGNPFDSPVESHGLEKKGALDLKAGDLMSHLVMKKKFLSAETRKSSSHSVASSAASTACDYDETDTLGCGSKADVNKTNYSTQRVINGRPSMRLLIERGLDQLVGNERLAVMGCGPWAMMDDLRAAVTNAYGDGDGQVPARQLEYFEDAFEW